MKSHYPGPAVGRREVLRAGGILALAHTMFADIGAAQTNPARVVEDRASSIRITKLEATSVDPKVFVKITTNQSIFGWGEISNAEPDVAAALARSMFEMLDGQNPTRIEHLWQRLYRAHRNLRDGAFMVHTIGAIDMALWDIAGKLYGVPVYRLLGGPTRDRIRVYNTPKARKLGVSGGQPYAGTPEEIERLVSPVRKAREQLGPEGALMYDAHTTLPPPLLIQFAAKVEPYDLMFIEEPAHYGNIEVYKRLKEKINIPLATGEKDRTVTGVIPYLINGCIDILQPDCCFVGGITQVKKIASVAEAFDVPIAPHCTMTELGMTASFHAAASVPNFLIHEGNPPDNRMPGVAHKTWTVDDDGYASLPEGPGLGVDIDEAMLAKRAAEPNRKFTWPKNFDPMDGAVSDY